jgi:hypothetical protein
MYIPLAPKEVKDLRSGDYDDHTVKINANCPVLNGRSVVDDYVSHGSIMGV